MPTICTGYGVVEPGLEGVLGVKDAATAVIGKSPIPPDCAFVGESKRVTLRSGTNAPARNVIL